MTEKKLGNLFSGPDGALAGIASKARDMQTLTATVRGALPEEVQPHLVAAAHREDGTLVLIAESSAWAARLRFSAGEAMAAAREFGVTAESCRVRVRPDRDEDQPT